MPAVERCDGKQQCREGNDEYGCLHLFNVANDGSIDVMTGSGFLGVGSDADNLSGVCALHWDMRRADMACQYVCYVTCVLRHYVPTKHKDGLRWYKRVL